jgi:hypothetical protein
MLKLFQEWGKGDKGERYIVSTFVNVTRYPGTTI